MRLRFPPGIAMVFGYLGSQKVLEGVFEAPVVSRWAPIGVMLAVGGIVMWLLSPPTQDADASPSRETGRRYRRDKKLF